MQTRILYLFTRTPLHVGAGSSVGAIDQPIIRERHTGFPVIPATSLKGTFADEWNERVKTKRKKPDGSDDEVEVIQRSADGRWLFGETDANNAAAGALLFGEARLLAFPIRSAKGSFAWITSPLLLRRAARDRVISETDIPAFPTGQDADGKALFLKTGPLALPDNKLVLEEYAFAHSDGDDAKLAKLGQSLGKLIANDPVWAEVATRLVILSDGQMSFFATTACEVAQHVRIDDETGTAAGGALFNQENVPSDTLFYAVLHATDERTVNKPIDQRQKANNALETFAAKLNGAPFQFGGDASTGLGYCTVQLAKPLESDCPAGTQKGA